MANNDFDVSDDALPSTSKTLEGEDAAKASQVDPVGDVTLGRSATINRPAAELYAYWRDFSNLATFMENVERIDVIDNDRSHWVVKAPAGKTIEWDAIVTEDADGQARRDLRRFKQLMETGWKNKIQAALAHVTPAAVLAEQHRKMAEPGTADR